MLRNIRVPRGISREKKPAPAKARTDVGEPSLSAMVALERVFLPKGNILVP